MAEGQIIAKLEHMTDILERTEKKLDDHIIRDEQTNKEFLLPLWNAYQQRKGAMTTSVVFYTLLSGTVGAIMAWWGHK